MNVPGGVVLKKVKMAAATAVLAIAGLAAAFVGGEISLRALIAGSITAVAPVVVAYLTAEDEVLLVEK